AEGDVYLSDPSAMTIYRIGPGGKPAIFRKRIAVAGQAFGPNGTLFGIVPGERRIVKLDAQGASRTVAKGIVGRGIVVTHAGTLYVSEPGAHNDMPSRIWQIKPGGEKRVVDQGLRSASGIAFSPDGSLFYAAENTTKWIYSYVVQPDGFLEDKQAFYWLHMTDIPNDSGAQDIAVDTHGNLYVATRMGVQISDQNGRVRAILPLPSPSGPVRGLCFGGEHFDFLYVTDGAQVFRRRMNVSGVAPWAAPVAFPSQGAG